MPPTHPILSFFFLSAGRITRREFALGFGFLFCLNFVLLIPFITRESATAGGVAMILGLPLLIAQCVVAAKRCHDIGLPGLFFLLLAVPFVQLPWLLVLFFYPGTPGPNAYGAKPSFID